MLLFYLFVYLLVGLVVSILLGYFWKNKLTMPNLSMIMVFYIVYFIGWLVKSILELPYTILDKTKKPKPYDYDDLDEY